MAGRARAVPVKLTVKRRRKLEQIVRAGSSPQRLVLRARIVLLAAGGAANAAIARQLGCSVAVARTWRHRFACRGIPGLFDKPRSGRPETHGPSARLAVVATTTSIPPEGESQWSHAMIAGHLGQRAWRSRRLPWAGCWPRPRPARTRSAAGSTAPATPPSDLIMDNGSSHTIAATGPWLAAHPRFAVTYTPKHASWLNMVVQWLGVLTRRLLRRGDFASRDDLDAQIIAFTIRHNKNARPYRWSYDADAEHTRYLARHLQPEPASALPEAA